MRITLHPFAPSLLIWSALLGQESPLRHSASATVPIAYTSDGTTPHGTCFRGHPQAECRAFFLTEWGWALRFGNQTRQYGHNSYWTWQLGWMRNVSSRDALGASLFLGAETDRFDLSGRTFGVKARYRRWLGPQLALDVGAGPALGGLVIAHGGWLIAHGALAYGDWVALEVQAEPGQKVFSDRSFATYAGIRFGSYPGTVLGIAAPLAVLVAIASSYSHGD